MTREGWERQELYGKRIMGKAGGKMAREGWESQDIRRQGKNGKGRRLCDMGRKGKAGNTLAREGRERQEILWQGKAGNGRERQAETWQR